VFVLAFVRRQDRTDETNGCSNLLTCWG